MLLIHGNYSGKSWWRELLVEPLPGLRFVAPDMPGFGSSAVNGNFYPSVRFYAKSLRTFLDHLGIEDALVVGHSFGGAVAMELAVSDPERFPGMLLLNTAPPGGLRTPEYLYPVLESYRRDRRALRRVLRRSTRTRVPDYLDELVDEARMMHPAGYSGNARALANWNVSAAARRYPGPVVATSGDRDTLAPPSSARATARAFPAGRYINLGEVGHSPQVEAPHLVRQLLVYLDRLTSE